MVKRIFWLITATLIGWNANIHAAFAQADPNKILRWAFEQAETGFDPVQTSDWYSSYVFANIYDTPLTYDYLARPLKLKPSVLEAMPEVSPDGTTYTLKFRKGIYFADDAAFNGQKRELIAADLVYSMKRVFDNKTKSPNLQFLDGKIAGMETLKQKQRDTGKFDFDAPIEGFTLLDRHTVRIKLAAPDYNFLYMLAYNNVTALVAREVVERYGDDIMAHPVGTGPYRLVDWKRSSRTVVEANPNFREEYWDAEPSATDARAQERFLPLFWRTDANKQMSRTPAMEVTYAYFAMEHPLVGGYTLEKIALRRALGLGYNTGDEIAINRKYQARAAHSPIGPGAFGYDENFRTIASGYDPAKARALLDVYGYVDRDGDGFRENIDGSPMVIEMSSSPTLRDRQLDENWKKKYARDWHQY